VKARSGDCEARYQSAWVVPATPSGLCVWNGMIYGAVSVQDGFLWCGCLWCVKEPEGKYITFNNVSIARQEEDGTWLTLAPGWKVTPAGSIDVHVQLNMAMVSCFPIDEGGANEEIRSAKTKRPAGDSSVEIRQSYKREPQQHSEVVKADCGRCRSKDPRSQPDHRTE
jgi:hypothetical protein